MERARWARSISAVVSVVEERQTLRSYVEDATEEVTIMAM